MMIDGLIHIFQSSEFKSLASTVAANIASTAISEIIKAKEDNQTVSHEWQLIHCLEQALNETQNVREWEKDPDAIRETFFPALFTFKENISEEALVDIFKKAVGHEVTRDDVNEWITQFLKQLSLPKHAALLEYLKASHLLRASDVPQISPTGRIITPRAPLWVSKDIICRDELVDLLYNKLSKEEKHLQLIGMGGIGKTVILFRTYAKSARDKKTCFEHVGLFIYNGNARDNLAKQLDFPIPYKGLHGEAAAILFLQNLCNEKKVLLLIDDIRENPTEPFREDAFIELLQSLRASVLLASRVRFPEMAVQEVPALSIDDCIQVFENKYGKKVWEERGDLTKIIEEKAGRNTLVVNRLGSITKDHGWSIRDLSDRLAKQNFNITKGIFDDEQLQQEINKLYLVNEKIDKTEQNILEAFSTFPSMPLSKDVCISWLCEDASVDSDNCALLLVRLAAQTWLEKHVAEDKKLYFSIHPIVNSAIKEQLVINYTNHKYLIEECASMIHRLVNDYELDTASQLIPFAVSSFTSLYCEEALIARLAKACGKYYRFIEDFTKALEWYQKALTIEENCLGKDHPETAITYNNIAIVYKRQWDNEAALEWYQKTLTIQIKVLGKDHPETATTYYNIANVYQDQWDNNKALKWYQKALAIEESCLGKDHRGTTLTYSSIASVYESQRDYKKALKWYHKCLCSRNMSLC